jgi:endonuclease/exonuclease/phosphatase family metal-dependent hydrolase
MPAGGAAGEASAPPRRLRIATYNVRNYNSELRHVDGRTLPDYPKPEAEKAALRLVLRTVDADVLALQETGGAPHVRELLRDLRREGLIYPHSAVLEGPDPRRRLAFISKHPFEVRASFQKLPVHGVPGVENVSRGLLGITLDTPSGPLACYAVHLKSRLTRTAADPQSANQRLAEARAIHEKISGLEKLPPPPAKPRRGGTAGGGRGVSGAAPERPGTPPPPLVLILGDFNDDPDSPPLLEFTGDARKGFRHFQAIPAADSRSETWTSNYARKDTYSRSDYILATRSALSHVHDGRGAIADTATALTASDHRLVWIDLQFL